MINSESNEEKLSDRTVWSHETLEGGTIQFDYLITSKWIEEKKREWAASYGRRNKFLLHIKNEILQCMMCWMQRNSDKADSLCKIKMSRLGWKFFKVKIDVKTLGRFRLFHEGATQYYELYCEHSLFSCHQNYDMKIWRSWFMQSIYRYLLPVSDLDLWIRVICQSTKPSVYAGISFHCYPHLTSFPGWKDIPKGLIITFNW